MKIRVMGSDGTVTDFEKDKMAEATILFNEKKKLVGKTKVLGDSRPSCNIHRCYHSLDGKNRPCEIIERFVK